MNTYKTNIVATFASIYLSFVDFFNKVNKNIYNKKFINKKTHKRWINSNKLKVVVSSMKKSIHSNNFPTERKKAKNGNGKNMYYMC